MWRNKLDSGNLSEPMTAEAIASLLFSPDGDLPWLVGDDGTESFAHAICEVQDALLDSYLPRMAQRYLREPGFGPLWLGSLVEEFCSADAPRAMTFIRALVAEAQTDEDLGYIGSGPLEDLLRRQGPQAIGLVEREAAGNPRFRYALAGVWSDTAQPEVWDRVAAALGDQPPY